ncbi:MAG: response regulator transcription factor [Deltaproteobacteria bacterium]|jgi:DNA-binding response OmpR family regulator|nr:response regulator transcription factor [Deltaproteobacteria bacterium]MBW2530479.1 response regulator transcription factor [Deltaproteobacteria bacterium]
MSRAVDRQETVLIVEDDPTLRMSLERTLRSAGYAVVTAATGPEGLVAAQSGRSDLVLLDVMLPGMNGFEICQQVRETHPELPIVMVTAKGEEEDKVRGLGLGADDYVVKPFGVAELLARVDAALRRTRLRRSETAVVSFGGVTVDFRGHQLTLDGVRQEVTALEMRLLGYFVERDGLLLTRQQILDAVWGRDYYGTERTVDNFVNRLRGKIERDPKRPEHLQTVRGAGYRFSKQGADPT